ncbi:aspartate-semialdehyde dehydrogenase [candidate division KSB1 bacterium]|nr:aspartate-semialdehyde dehydrogenase [candidate division KSB1 bacterium]
MEKIKVGILGATGTVGQRFVQLLENHPWFQISELAASESSAGNRYEDICNWKLSTPIPENIKKLTVKTCTPDLDCKIVFSGLDAKVAGEIEIDFAKAGYPVISNARNYRMEQDVPLLIPEVNPDHLQLINKQKANRNFSSGFIVTNPNCSTIPLVMALAPLNKKFVVEKVLVTTLQAISGAGYPGLPSLDILDNVIPFIGGEEEKIETETKKITGDFIEGKVSPAQFDLSAQVNRVPVLDGHLMSVSIKLKNDFEIEEVKELLKNFTAIPQERELPSAPKNPIILMDENDRPQPRLDRDAGNGMSIVVGRIRSCPVLDVKFSALGHNTIRGAAGAAILNAELLKVEGYFS